MRFASAMIFILLVIPTTLAGQHENATEIGNDPQGDVLLGATAQTTAEPESDLIQLLLNGNQTHFQATITVADLAGRQQPQISGATYLLYLHHGQQQYRIQVDRIARAIEAGTITYTAELHEYQPLLAKFIPVDTTVYLQPREADNSVDIGVPYKALPDQNHLEPLPGTRFTQIYVEAIGEQDRPDDAFVEDNVVYDRMPDRDAYTWQIAHAGRTGLTMQVDNPTRVTNGGATTFAFLTKIGNPNDAPINVEFTVSAPPESWQAVVVDKVLTVPAQSTANTTVLVTIPGAHGHGDLVALRVAATDLSSGVQDEQVLRIQFTDPPQPAGHHDTIFLKSIRRDTELPREILEAQGGHASQVFMNAKPPTAEETSEPVNHNEPGGHGWDVHLSPALAIGLDFDLNRTGLLEFHVEPFADRGPTGVRMRGQLVLRGQVDVVLADIPEVEVGAVNGPTVAELLVVPTTASDFVPYDEGRELILQVRYTRDELHPSVSPTGLDMLPAGFLRLPLNEFHDAAPLITDAGVRLDGAAMVPVAPGAFGFAPLSVTNRFVGANHVEFSAVASESLVEFVPSAVDLGVADQASVKVKITPPASASHGWSERIVLIAQDASGGPSAVYAVTVIVDQDAEVPLVEGTVKSTPFPLAGLLMLVIALATRRRRHREA